MTPSLQQQYAANSICFGCGPANHQGLQIASYVEDGHLIAHWQPQAHHHAFPGVLNGGIIGTLLDCHCNWAAAYYLMKDQKKTQLPATVTAEYTIKLLKPTPIDTPLTLIATLDTIDGNRATINGQLTIDSTIYDTCKGTFVAVSQGHPAFHRW